MGKKLIITEKPSVAQEFAKALNIKGERGDGFIESEEYLITWCVGHLITMSYPDKYSEELKTWDMRHLPFIPDTYLYEVIEDVKKQYKVVSGLLNRKDVEIIYYSGDSAREGEYIQRLIRQKAGHTAGAIEKRVWIDSQTYPEILRGIREARDLKEYDSLADAAYLRAQEDYLFGINLSRAYFLQYKSLFYTLAELEKPEPVAIGRVMSCVLGMIVDRERAIRNTVEVPFYGICGEMDGIKAEWRAAEGSRFYKSPLLHKESAFRNRSDAEDLQKSFSKSGTWKLVKKEEGRETKYAPLLYNLAELQAECSARLKISPDETLRIAQALYEKKLTTYPRTDARVLSSAVAKEIVGNLEGMSKSQEYAGYIDVLKNNGNYGQLSHKKYVDDSKISDHYAIIPTGRYLEIAPTLPDMEKKVFHMIVQRFLSIFFAPAVYGKVSLVFSCGSEVLLSGFRYLQEPGYLQIYGTAAQDANQDNTAMAVYKGLQEGKAYPATFSVTEGKSGPQKRYTSGSLILAMENAGQLLEDPELREYIKGSGIGTSATRAETIKKLETRAYIRINEKSQTVTPTKKGEALYDIIKEVTPVLLNPRMTASWEKGLSQVAGGQLPRNVYYQKLTDYVRQEIGKIKELPESVLAQKMGIAIKPIQYASETRFKCPVCGKKLRKMDWGIGCSGYQEGCKYAISGTAYGKKLTDEQLYSLLTAGKTKKIAGLKKKTGAVFAAVLVLDPKTGKISASRN